MKQLYLLAADAGRLMAGMKMAPTHVKRSDSSVVRVHGVVSSHLVGALQLGGVATDCKSSKWSTKVTNVRTFNCIFFAISSLTCACIYGHVCLHSYILLELSPQLCIAEVLKQRCLNLLYSFLISLKRFVARYGLPKSFVSDNGQTSKAAGKGHSGSHGVTRSPGTP